LIFFSVDLDVHKAVKNIFSMSLKQPLLVNITNCLTDELSDLADYFHGYPVISVDSSDYAIQAKTNH